MIQLQVADLVAYETFRYHNETRMGDRPQRWQYQMLRARVRKEVFFDDAYLEELTALNEGRVAGARLRAESRGDT